MSERPQSQHPGHPEHETPQASFTIEVYPSGRSTLTSSVDVSMLDLAKAACLSLGALVSWIERTGGPLPGSMAETLAGLRDSTGVVAAVDESRLEGRLQ